MRLHEIKPKTPQKKSRRVGRGGKRGKTSGRGMKGQRARAGHKIRPEIRDMIKKLPKRRGFGKNRARGVNATAEKPVTVNVGILEASFSDGDSVTPLVLHEKRLVRKISGKIPPVKILGNGEFTKKLVFSNVSFSAKAKARVDKLG